MDIKALFKQLTSKASNTARVFVVVQPSAIYLSSPSLSIEEGEAEFPVEGDWLSTLEKAISSLKAASLSVDVVLHSNLYQSYQIDKPNVPREEWSSALPFLLKDLITEKVTDIVADAALVPGNNKVQAYVVAKSLVLDLLQRVTSSGHTMGRLLIEDDVWGHSAGELSNFLLLQRSKDSSFRVSAFVDNKCAFQRTMRGVVAPLTGVASSALQLDGVALELQRSIDYLSSQLKGTSLHQLKVCCDEELHDELAQSLDERLSVKVSRLSQNADLSGQVLAQHVTEIESDDINLFPAHLQPKQERFTLANVVAVWALVSVMLLGGFGYYRMQNSSLESELKVVQSQQAKLNSQLRELQGRLADHKPSAEKIAAVNRLKLEVQAQQGALKAVGEFDESQQLGYSGIMRSLAQLGRNDISLNYILIDEHNLDLKGLARDAQAIPNWVNQFKTELSLIGRAFEKLNIARNEDNIITFELKTKGGTQ